MPRGDGYTQVFFRDPDGHVLEFFQHPGEDQITAPGRAPVRRSHLVAGLRAPLAYVIMLRLSQISEGNSSL